MPDVLTARCVLHMKPSTSVDTIRGYTSLQSGTGHDHQEPGRHPNGETGGHCGRGRAGDPDEVARVILMLMTNDYMTGEVVHVDGGGRFV